MTLDGARVERLLGAPELGRFVDVLARRIERGRALEGRISLLVADAGERAAIAAILGRRLGSGASLSVDLDRVDEIVRTSGAALSLAAAVEHLRGPLVVRAEQVEAERRAWEAVFVVADAFIADRPEYAPWAGVLRSRGAVRRLAGTPDTARRLVERVVAVLAELPSDGEALPQLAAHLLGSAHALDVGTAEAALVLSALNGGEPVPGDARTRRELWAGAGVAMDELSSTVLVHRLPLPGPLGELTRSGEPVILTLRQLRHLPVRTPRSPVFVCENPSVVDAAARELGEVGPPLVCIQGQPSLAAGVLLTTLADAGLRYHGDFDWGGVRIANRMHQQFGFEPWRYGTADLDRAADLPGVALKGKPVDARWDEKLRPALESRATRLEEEQVIDLLVADLSVS